MLLSQNNGKILVATETMLRLTNPAFAETTGGVFVLKLIDMEEVWRKIEGYPLYEVSNFGNLKTFNCKNQGTTKIMKPAKDACGYLRTMLLGTDKKFHTIKVHRIVAKAFITNPENKPQVNHKNGIRHDNQVDNLEWCTASENINHAYQKLNKKRLAGELNPAATVTNEQVLKIRSEYKQIVGGKITTKKDLAIKFGVSFYVVKRIVERKAWKHI